MDGARRGARWRSWLVHLLAATLVGLGALAQAPSASAAEPDPALLSPCSTRSGFGGKSYCRVVVDDVTSSRHGPGKRVYVTGTVSAATDTTMTVSEVHMSSYCPPGKLCGATLKVWFVDLTVQTPGWSGVRQPKVGHLVRLYGTTTVDGTLEPSGYVKGAFCGPRYEFCL